MSPYLVFNTSVHQQGAGTEEAGLIDILASRTNAEIKTINAFYKKGKRVLVHLGVCRVVYDIRYCVSVTEPLVLCLEMQWHPLLENSGWYKLFIKAITALCVAAYCLLICCSVAAMTAVGKYVQSGF